MELYEAIEKRRTIRDFENEPIPSEIIERIINAGLQAPTNDHMRDWHYIVIQDKNTVIKLLDIIPKGISDEDMEQLLKDWNLTDVEHTKRNKGQPIIRQMALFPYTIINSLVMRILETTKEEILWSSVLLVICSINWNLSIPITIKIFI